MLVYDQKYVHEANAVFYGALITMCIATGVFAYVTYLT